VEPHASIRRLVLAPLVAALLVGGCSDGGNSGRPHSDATLEILAPPPGATTGPNVELVMRLVGARIVPPTQIGGALRGDQGHIHLLVDGVLVAMPLSEHEALPDLPRGLHTVEAEFVASDHLAFANHVIAAVTFRVR